MKNAINQKQARELGYCITQTFIGGAYVAMNIRKETRCEALTMKTLLKRIAKLEGII